MNKSCANSWKKYWEHRCQFSMVMDSLLSFRFFVYSFYFFLPFNSSARSRIFSSSEFWVFCFVFVFFFNILRYQYVLVA